MVIQANLCYIFREQDVLLQKKTDGLFGGGKWNAPGGKALATESMESAVRREVLEEAGLTLTNLEKAGKIWFFLGPRETLDQVVHVFTSNSFKGRPAGSREGKLSWFSKCKLPFSEMWEDDEYWVPLLLAGKKFVGEFYFTSGYSALTKYWVSTHPLIVEPELGKR